MYTVLTQKKVAIIGGGNMGQAIASAMLEKGGISPTQLSFGTPRPQRLQAFAKKGVFVTNENVLAVQDAAVVLFAVKPQLLATVLESVQSVISPSQLVISVAAGISISFLKKHLHVQQPIARVMPNLCAQIGESMSVWVKSPEVTKEQELFAHSLLVCLGQVAQLDQEDQIDMATAISGSGPAYVFYLAELLERESIRLGLSADVARLLSRQTVIGSGTYLEKSSLSAEDLRKGVTSKGGTTESAFVAFRTGHLEEVFAAGIEAAYLRAKELQKA